MKKTAILAMILALAFVLGACSKAPQPASTQGPAARPAEAAPENNDTPIPGSSLPESTSQPPALSEEEEKLVGVWEADDGGIVAVRPRGNRDHDDFAFDAIYLEPLSGEWVKITRDETTFEVSDGVYIMSDLYLCPDPSNPQGAMVQTEERLEYDPESDVLVHTSRHPTPSGEVMEWINTLRRTDKSPTDPSIEWDWYYDIHPSRQ